MDAKMEREYLKGGEFLIAEQTAGEAFTPEEFSEEQRMIGDTTREFVDNEVRPNLEALERRDPARPRAGIAQDDVARGQRDEIQCIRHAPMLTPSPRERRGRD